MPEIRVIIPETMELALDSLIRAGFAGNKAEIVRAAITQYLSTFPTILSKNYDLESVFSPDGRIHQIEYAIESSKRGLITVGLCSKEGIVLIKRLVSGESPSTTLIKPRSYFRTIKYIADNIAISITGLSADARLVIKEAMKHAQSYDQGKKINIYNLVEDLSSFIHSYTLKKEVRVLGSSFIIGGLDPENVPKLFFLEPSGALFEFKAIAAGNGDEEANKTLQKEYSESISLEKTLLLGMKTALQGKKDPENLLIDMIDTQSKKFREITLDEKKVLHNKLWNLGIRISGKWCEDAKLFNVL